MRTDNAADKDILERLGKDFLAICQTLADLVVEAMPPYGQSDAVQQRR